MAEHQLDGRTTVLRQRDAINDRDPLDRSGFPRKPAMLGKVLREGATQQIKKIRGGGTLRLLGICH
jgi:hypothetical protein